VGDGAGRRGLVDDIRLEDPHAPIHAAQVLRTPCREIVEDRHRVLLGEGFHQMASDEAGATGDQDSFSRELHAQALLPAR